jgi:DNA-binding transcriptional ArsR family regulator
MSERRDAVFQALADPTRREVVSRLAAEGSMTATELAAGLPVSRQAVAKHLSALAEAGLVSPTREGREVRYRFTPGPMSDAVGWIADVGAEWDVRLDALKRHLAR